MRKIVQTVEIDGQGLDALLGEKVTVFCVNYFYHGILAGVNEHDILLEDAFVVYETGVFSTAPFKDAQYIAKEWRIRISSIESYGIITGK